MIFMRLLVILGVLSSLCGCVTTPTHILAPMPIINRLSTDECILQAFIKEDPIFEKEKIYSALLSFRKFAPEGTIHYFFWYIDKLHLRHIRNEWWTKRAYNRILANYRYYKKTNERLQENPIDPVELLRKAILNEK